jgi:hypothetical protein
MAGVCLHAWIERGIIYFSCDFSTSDTLYFGWHASAGQSAYEMTIKVKSLGVDRTGVELELLTQNPE